jgi:signal transduction histidine kinase
MNAVIQFILSTGNNKTFRKKLVLLVAAGMIFITNAVCQINKIDSLKFIIQQKKIPKEKLKAIFILCESYESLNPDTLYVYNQQAKILAAGLSSDTDKMLTEYFEAVYLFKKNKLDSALTLTKALITKYRKVIPYDNIVVNLYVLKFNEYWRKNNFNEAISTSQELLKMAEEHQDSTGLIKGMIDMGAAYHIVSNQPKEGLKWYYQAFGLLTTEALKSKYSSVFQNIAIAYDDLKIKDSTIKYLKKGLQYARLGDNKTNLARALRLYASIMADYKYFTEAEPAFSEAIEVQRSIGDVFGTAKAMQGEADFYSSTGSTQKAIAVYLETLKFAKENGLTQVMIYDLYQNLAQVYQTDGNYKKTNELLQIMLAIKDSNYKINSAQSLAEMQTKYDVQKKETLIAQQKLDLFQRKLFLYGGGILTILLLALLAFRFNKYKKQQKIKNELSVKEAEEKERKRIGAELHDNLGVQANAILHNSFLLQEDKNNNQAAVINLQETAKEMLYNLRETLWAMKTADVTATDLWLRIINFMKQMGRHYTNISFKVEGLPPENFTIASSQALHIILVLQESVNNSVKHAGAQIITATSIISVEGWQIQLADDGKGFNLDDAMVKSDSYGLSNMQQRAAEGKFKYGIESVQGKGTTTTIGITAC